MNVIHFGAGNIGRGFIAPILREDKNIDEIKFLDVNKDIVEIINKEKKYIVTEVGEVNNKINITNISANVSDDITLGLLDEYIKSVSYITISIGQQNLKFIIKYFEYILKIRDQIKKPIVILCCENGNRVSSIFKNLLLENKIKSDLLKFVDVVVDRIVPDQSKDSINVVVEKYYSWIVDELQWPKEIEKIKSIQYSNKLDSEVNKKICLLNGVHSSLSWYRFSIDQFKETILQNIIEKEDTVLFFNNLTKELVDIISKQYGFEKKYLEDYVRNIYNRFKNPKIKDEMFRIARNPITKIQLNERILNPLLFAHKNKLKCDNLKSSFNYLLSYSYKNDKEAVELNEFLIKNGRESTLKKFIKNISEEDLKFLNSF